MNQKKGKILSIGFTCPTSIAEGDVVVVTNTDNTIAKVSTEASIKKVGVVATHIDGATTCVVETPYRERRNDRECTAVFNNGPFVWGATGKAVSYVQGTIASVTGTQEGPFTLTDTIATAAVGSASETFDFEAAVGGTFTSGTGPYTFETGVSDKVKITVEGGGDQTFTLSGSGQTATQVAAMFSAAVGFTATTVETATKVKFLATDATKDLTLGAITNDAYTILGLTADTYEATEGNDTLKLNVDGEASQTFTLTGSGRTAAQVAAQISGTGFTATDEDGSVVLTADDPESDLEIEACDNDCYTELGLTVGTYASVPGTNRLLIAITGGGESGGADQEFELTDGERTATQVATEINQTALDFEATNVDNYIVLTALQIGDDIVIKNPTLASAYTALGFTAGTTAGDVPTYSPAAIVGMKISGPEPLTIYSGIESPYTIASGTSKLKLNIGGGASQTFTLDTGSAVTAETLAATINNTASGFTASSTGYYLALTADAAGNDIEIETVADDCYDVVGFTVGTTSASMIINTLEK